MQTHLKDAYQRCAPYIVGHLVFLLGDQEEARDVFQEVLVRYAAFLNRGGRVEFPLRFLKKTATRLALRLLRRKRWQERQSPAAGLPDRIGETPEESLRILEMLRAVWDVLDARGKVVAKALLVDEMTVSEISAYTGIPRSSVLRRIEKIQSVARKNGLAGLDKRLPAGQNRPVDASSGIEGLGEPGGLEDQENS